MNPCVLYVDDEVSNLRVFEIGFKKDFPVVTLTSAEEALAYIEKHAPNVGVVLADQRMPKMTGIELLEKCQVLVPDAHRMLLTANSEEQLVIDAVNKGRVHRYFVKPFKRAELLAVLRDALHIFSLQLQLKDLQNRMLHAERLATLGQVSAGVAHELMNPISYLTQNIASLKRDLPLISQRLKDSLTSADQELKHIVLDLPQLVADLESGMAHLRQVATGLKTQARGEVSSSVATDLAVAVNFAAKIARVEISNRARLHLDGESVMVRGSSVALTQILLNLIVNAAHAMEGKSDGLITVSWKGTMESVLLTIADNGCGIPAENLSKVFEPLFTTKPPGMGTGLGLSICRDLAKKLGGDIQLRSKVGEGTKVEVRLPRPS
jgi:C4-dicarboxylate-specific signal transduction histidine kinase